jgi:hypothetical protein
MILRLAILHENARSALECGSEAAALTPNEKAVASATALQGAFGTSIFMHSGKPKDHEICARNDTLT